MAVKTKNIHQLWLANIWKFPRFFTTMHGLDMNLLGTCKCSHPHCVPVYTKKTTTPVGMISTCREPYWVYTLPTELTYCFPSNWNFLPFSKKKLRYVVGTHGLGKKSIEWLIFPEILYMYILYLLIIPLPFLSISSLTPTLSYPRLSSPIWTFPLCLSSQISSPCQILSLCTNKSAGFINLSFLIWCL